MAVVYSLISLSLRMYLWFLPSFSGSISPASINTLRWWLTEGCVNGLSSWISEHCPHPPFLDMCCSILRRFESPNALDIFSICFVVSAMEVLLNDINISICLQYTDANKKVYHGLKPYCSAQKKLNLKSQVEYKWLWYGFFVALLCNPTFGLNFYSHVVAQGN